MHIPAPTKALLSALTIGAAIMASAAKADIVSTFDNGPEGWSTINDAMNFTWDAAIGNTGGAIRAADQANGTNWYFAGSDAYHGDLSSYYGGAISWDTLGIAGNHNPLDRADLIVVGGGLRIGIDTSLLPVNGEWISMTTDLVEGEWAILDSLASGVLTDTLATEAQIHQILADVSGFYVRGEFAFGGDSSAIDNVALVPSPGTPVVLGAAGLLFRRRRRAFKLEVSK